MRSSFPSNISFGSLAIAAFTAFSLLCSQAVAASSKYAAIVVDARTGRVLHSENADSRRFPASLTKMMTLYLTFEAMERGKIKKNTPVVFSAQAASQAPTKIGVKAGRSISVEQAILSLVTRSANDSSVALAELVGGSEQRFALMMTQKARALGMRSTIFRNPNGLPNPAQFTTARDMATLGIALREHFPQYYGYFSVRSFQFGRQRIANHNKLLGRIQGVDGIKTGYTNASGFNLVSSVTDGKRRLVAVVMGGASGGARDARMAQLINAYMPKAQPGKGALLARQQNNVVDDVTPVAIRADEAPTPMLKPEQEVAAVATEEVGEGDIEMVAPKKMTRAERRAAAKAAKEATKAVAEAAAESQTDAQPQMMASLAPAPKRPRMPIDDTLTASTTPAGKWVVQVGASPSQSEARQALAKAKSVGVFASAEGYTVAFEKGGQTIYRARLGGFASKTAATNACNAAKRERVSCYATQQD